MNYLKGFTSNKQIPIYTDLSEIVKLESRLNKLCINEEMGYLLMLSSRNAYNNDEIILLEQLIRKGLTFQVIDTDINDKIPLSRKVVVGKDDTLIPICHEGQNRSQVMFIVANYIKEKLNCTVYRPHGAMGGYDPYQAYDNLTEDNVYGYILSENQHITKPDEWLHRNFKRAFGIKKQDKILKERYDELNIKLNPNEDYITPASLAKLSDDRKKMRSEFNSTLYNTSFLKSMCKSKTSKIILLCFGTSMKIFIKRLFENLVGYLHNIHIVLIPWPDTIAHTPQIIIDDLAKNGVRKNRDKENLAAHLYAFQQYANMFAVAS